MRFLTRSMASAKAPCVDRPRATFRVGVSGTITITDKDRVRGQVAAALRDIRDHVRDCVNSQAARRIYDLSEPPLLRVISPLADGADRLVADEALLCGFQLDVPLPFDRENYKATFKHETPMQYAASVADFNRLLRRAGSRVLTLDGERGDETDRHRSYEAVGRLVVRNCDLLIAIWDDTARAGRGGTADIVQYALRAGVPVWWINAADDVLPQWLQEILDLPRFGTVGVPATTPRDAMREYIERVILPPDPVGADCPSAWDRAIGCLRWVFGVEDDPLLTFLAETGRPNRQCWNVHPNLSRFIRRHGRRYHERRQVRLHPGSRTAPPAPGLEPVVARQAAGRNWHQGLVYVLSWAFRRNAESKSSSPAAALSRMYQHCYRSSYLLVFVCGAVALICAATGLTFEAAESFLMFVEVLMLAVILLLVVGNEVLRWHERYLSYRMFAELLRLSQHLHALGWSLSGSRINNLARSTRRNWVAWFFAATARAVPLATTDFKEKELIRLKADVVGTLIDTQLHFHDERHQECSGAAEVLGIGGRWLFLATVFLVVVRVVLWLSGFSEERWLSLLSAVLPALSAALFGLRAYEEFEVLAQQSERMHEALERAKARIKRIRTDRPLASQVLGVEVNDVVTLMLSDVEGWAQLFRMKAVEA